VFMLCLQVALASAWFEAVVHLAANVSLLTVLGCVYVYLLFHLTHTPLPPPPPTHHMLTPCFFTGSYFSIGVCRCVCVQVWRVLGVGWRHDRGRADGLPGVLPIRGHQLWTGVCVLNPAL
jgi:hypothetical protein